jgi:hypothetical protein
MEKYQEQSQLLDPHLEAMIEQVMSIVRSVIFTTQEKQNIHQRHALFKILYTITKVRGYKTICTSAF